MLTQTSGDWSRIAAILLIIGAVFSTATQLRIGSIPLGPGEMLIVAGVLVGFGMGDRSKTTLKIGPCNEFLVFWVLAGAALALGTLSGTVAGSDPGETAVHDGIAYLFVAVFCVSLESSAARNPTRTLCMLTYAAAIFLLATGLCALLVREVAGIQLWYQVVRLRGFSDNPNQLALLAVALPFLCWQLLHDHQVSARRLLWTLSLIGLVAGVMTWSDALIVSWCIAIVIVFTILAVRGLRRLRSPVMALFLVAMSIAAVSTLLFAGLIGQLGSNVLGLGLEAYESGAQGSVRISLWRNAIEALWRSRMLGLGPGAHAGLLGPFERMEAHNAFIDWAAASGLFGLALLCAIVSIVVVRCVSAGKWYLVGALISLMTFGAFHHTLRQPLFWCCLIAISYYAKGVAFERQVKA